MKNSVKAINQNPEGRGYSNGDLGYLGNFTNEVTFNVALGKSEMLYYKRLGLLKFATLNDAMEYLKEVGATEGTVKNKEYYSLVKQDGCCFSTIGFYSIK